MSLRFVSQVPYTFQDIAAFVFWTFVILVIPIVGIALALVFHNSWWLWLLVPLLALHEGGLFLIIVALAVVWGILGV